MFEVQKPPPGWRALYYIYPATVFTFFAASLLYTSIISYKPKNAPANHAQSATRRPFMVMLFYLLFTYLGQIMILGSRYITAGQWLADDSIIVGYLSCILIYGTQITLLLDGANIASYAFCGSWYIALPFEVIIAVLDFTAGFATKSTDISHISMCLLLGSRCWVFAILVGWSLIDLYWRSRGSATDEERQGLLNKDVPTSPTADGTGYGATDGTTSSNTVPETTWERLDREAREAMEKRFKDGGNWISYVAEYKILLPYIWPRDSPTLQLRAAGVGVCLLTSNALNVLIPRQTGIIMDSLNGTTDSNPWLAVAVFAALRLAASQTGVEFLRQWLWIPVKYYSFDALTRAAYSHVMRLSADFHDSKSSSDMIVAFWGGRAISGAVENVLLQAIPMLLDLAAAIIYLSVTFGVYEGLIIITTGITFLIMTGNLMAKCRQASRAKESHYYREHYLRQTGLTGWQTVSAFNQIGYEENRHAEAVTTRWLKQHNVDFIWAVSIAFQTIVLTSGLLASAFLAVSRIRSGLATAGQFTMLLMYWSQLTGPLQFFARLGRSLGDSFLQAEHLLDMMKQKPTIENKKGARPLKLVKGEVRFEDVCFSYDKKKEILKNISFKVPAGETVAFVGATGAGKSTMLKLLDRFYDVTGGSILIDGQDIRDVDLYSLRDRIGVVPQSPILFDDSIMNNVRYGRLTATDEEVYEACRAACMHDKIETFTNGYNTHVGERGMKLSGGELQRLAIARAILKQPELVLLDEATSAVDTDTEQQIQRSLKTLCQGRTTFIVAHRLSTIMNADRIIVIEHGQIVEQGAHSDLILANGRYADLWSKQVFLKPEEQKDSVILPTNGAKTGSTTLSQTTSSQCDKKMTVKKNDEGSKLNPVAPAFTPRKEATRESIVSPTGSSQQMQTIRPGSLILQSQAGLDGGVIEHAAPITTRPQTRDNQDENKSDLEALPSDAVLQARLNEPATAPPEDKEQCNRDTASKGTRQSS